MLDKLKRNHALFAGYGKTCGVDAALWMYLHYLFLRKKEGVELYDYFNHRLFDKSIDHREYYASLHKNIHRWKNVSKKFCQEKSGRWFLIHKIDYWIAKLLYPGLDAMDYFRYEFYNFGHAKRKTFITEGGIAKMDRRFNGGSENREALSCLGSKAKFNTLFSDYVGRKWIDAEQMTWESYEEFCQGLEKVIVKPTDSCGGNGIFIWDLTDKKGLFDQIHGKHFIVEELLVQHDSVQKINPAAINTIRVYSVLSKGEVTVTAGVFRIGSGKDPTDNYSAGGMAAKIDLESGLIVSRAVMQSGQTTYLHPMTRQPIIGFQIPCWEQVKLHVKEAHKRIPKLRYIAWDVVVCKDESIVFLEANTFGGVALQQHPSLEGMKAIYDALL